jgi:tRNA threonylcarbamoyladenosine biosynthesis protein TsaE
MILNRQYKLSELPSIAKEIIKAFDSYSIILFYGEVGAGKTSLINEITKQLGVNQPASSPTFSIVNEYITKAGEEIFHMDLYRLKSMDEALEIGLDEYIYSGGTCLIEWPQIIEGLIFDEKCLAIEIIATNPDMREIIISDVITED